MSAERFEIAHWKTHYECACHCGWRGDVDKLAAMPGAALTPGHMVPAGRCPKCDELAYPADPSEVGGGSDAERMRAALVMCKRLAWRQNARGREDHSMPDSLCDRADMIAETVDSALGPVAAPIDPTPESMAREAESLLRRARDLLAQAGAPRAADKVRAAIKSAGGAVRHAQGKADRARNAARQPDAPPC